MAIVTGGARGIGAAVAAIVAIVAEGGRAIAVRCDVADEATVTAATSRSHYSSAKAGLLGFTKSLALELGRHGVTVNAIYVAGGPVD